MEISFGLDIMHKKYHYFAKPENEKSMQNPNFIKLLGLCAAALLVAFGFYLTPQVEDYRELAYRQPVTAFLKGFHHIDDEPENTKLPKVILQSAENREVDLQELIKGRVTIINFWATWCAPCIEELPSLAKFQAANPDILILPVSLDIQKTMPELAKFFAKDETRDLRWFYDKAGSLRKGLNLPVYPSTYVLDKKGKIIYILQGPNDWSSKDALGFGKYLVSKS